MPTSNPQPAQTNPESWEQHETQIRLERADEFAKLSPAEQQKVLSVEKVKFEIMRKEAKDELGFKPFDPAKANAERPTPEQEEAERQKALTNFEQSLHASPATRSEKGLPTNEKSAFDEQRFYKLFEAAIDNINGQKPFEFRSAAINDFGQSSSHIAKMTKLTDHSQKKELATAETFSRLKEKKTTPNQITLRVEVDMGEDRNNSLGLTNLSFEIPLVALLEGHFVQKLTKFTNLVFFAALLHNREKNKPVKPAEDHLKLKPGESEKTAEENRLKKFGLTKVAENGGLQGGDSAFEQGDASAVAFSCNNGFIWGTFDQHGAPDNPKELREALDKSNQET